MYSFFRTSLVFEMYVSFLADAVETPVAPPLNFKIKHEYFCFFFVHLDLTFGFFVRTLCLDFCTFVILEL